MKTKKIGVAMAAVLLGMQIGSMATAAVTQTDLATIESMVEAGQIEELRAYLQANPELLELSGSLGDSIRNFAENPTSSTLNDIVELSGGDVAVAIRDAAVASGISIY